MASRDEASLQSPTTAGASSAEKKRRARGKNFQAHEDLRLCSAWLATTSGGQPLDNDASFWERACVVFNNGAGHTDGESVATTAVRSYQALQSRWSALQKAIAAFSESYDHVCMAKRLREVGENEDALVSTNADEQEKEKELLQQAQIHYAQSHRAGSKFALLPCWELLRATPAWQKYVERSGRGVARPNSQWVLSRPTTAAVTTSSKDDASTDDEMANGVTAKKSTSGKKRRAIEALAVTQDIVPDADDATARAPSAKHSKRAPPVSRESVFEVAAINEEPLMVLSPPSVLASVVLKGGGFLSVFSPPTAFAANEDEQFLQWSVRENRALPAAAVGEENKSGGDAETRSFALFDDNRRIETLVGGVYELNLYLEPQGNDASKYYLEINGNPVTEFRASTSANSGSSGGGSRRSSLQPAVQAPDGEDDETIPFKTANAAQVQLNKWDMVALRRKADSSNSVRGKTPFARFIIEFVRHA